MVELRFPSSEFRCLRGCSFQQDKSELVRFRHRVRRDPTWVGENVVLAWNFAGGNGWSTSGFDEIYSATNTMFDFTLSNLLFSEENSRVEIDFIWLHSLLIIEKFNKLLIENTKTYLIFLRINILSNILILTIFLKKKKTKFCYLSIRSFNVTFSCLDSDESRKYILTVKVTTNLTMNIKN